MAAKRNELLDKLFELTVSLEHEDLLDTCFMDSYSLKMVHDSTFFLELVENFCKEVQDAMRDLGSALEDHFLCYDEMYLHYIKLKRIIESVGVSAMRRGLEALFRGIVETSRRECILAQHMLHQGYQNLRPHLRAITRLERRIIYLERTLTGDFNDDE